MISAKVVVGGQFGSEAKAKAAIHLSKSMVEGKGWRLNLAGIRCGGPNAGHTIWINDWEKYVLRLVPSLVVNPNAKLFISAGAMVSVPLLLREMEDLEKFGISVKNRLMIDPEAAVVDESAVQMEKQLGLGDNIGSTQTGTGGAASLRCLRKTKSAAEMGELAPYISPEPVWKVLQKQDMEVIVEGTQGYGLSLYHAGYYPFCTSKPATAMQFLTEAGIPPQLADAVVVVVRTYPIRVGGNSGPMKNEINWEVIRQRSGYPYDITEMTSVTKRVRRVAEFDIDMVMDAIAINGATQLAVHGLDYLDHSNFKAREWRHLAPMTKEWLDNLEDKTGTPIAFAFTGPHQDDVVKVNGRRV